MPLNNTYTTTVAATLEHTDVVFHNCVMCQKVQSRPLLSIQRGRNQDNKGLFMMRLLHTQSYKNLREKIYQEVGITLPCTGGGKK